LKSVREILSVTNAEDARVSGAVAREIPTIARAVEQIARALGRVYDNWMIGVALTNRKLRRRGLRILVDATGRTVAEAQRALGQAKHDLRVAMVMLKSRVRATEARRRLRKTGGNLRRALELQRGRAAPSRGHG